MVYFTYIIIWYSSASLRAGSTWRFCPWQPWRSWKVARARDCFPLALRSSGTAGVGNRFAGRSWEVWSSSLVDTSCWSPRARLMESCSFCFAGLMPPGRLGSKMRQERFWNATWRMSAPCGTPAGTCWAMSICRIGELAYGVYIVYV